MAQLRTCEVESKNLAPDMVVLASFPAPYKSNAKEKFSGPYPKTTFFLITDSATFADKPKDGAISIGKSFFRKPKLKLTIIRKTPKMITVIGNKNFDILNPGLFKLSKVIIAAIPAIAMTQSTHQLRTISIAKARNTPTIFKYLTNEAGRCISGFGDTDSPQL